MQYNILYLNNKMAAQKVRIVMKKGKKVLATLFAAFCLTLTFGLSVFALSGGRGGPGDVGPYASGVNGYGKGFTRAGEPSASGTGYLYQYGIRTNTYTYDISGTSANGTSAQNKGERPDYKLTIKGSVSTNRFSYLETN